MKRFPKWFLKIVVAISRLNSRRGPKNIVGQNYFMETPKGKIRTLTYNMDKKEKMPVYINFHASGFIMNHVEIDDSYLARLADVAQIKIVNVEYSLSPESAYPTALEEGYYVIDYLKKNAKELNIDETKMMIGGQSAGGNIATSLILLNQDYSFMTPDALILCFPLLDLKKNPKDKPRSLKSFPNFMLRIFNESYLQGQKVTKYNSPFEATNEELATFPRTLMLTAQNDRLTKECYEFAKRLEQVGVSVFYKNYPNTEHMFTHTDTKEGKESWDDILKFINNDSKTKRKLIKRN